MGIIIERSLSQLRLLHKGKVRNIYDIGDGLHLLIVATDRVSAYDHVLPTPIPSKGAMLTKMSRYWFEITGNIVPNHIQKTDITLNLMRTDEFPDIMERAMVVRKAKKLPIEAIVRGYLSGSGWKEYQKTEMVCGNKLRAGLLESAILPNPIFTPSTKEENGEHDKNITFEEMTTIVGNELAEQIRDISLKLYTFAAKLALTRGIIIADTKFEFGLIGNELILIDEIFTPDSSRFWPKEKYKPGIAQESFDKQYIRDYLDNIKWNRTPPAPVLPAEVVQMTVTKYREALQCFGIKTDE